MGQSAFGTLLKRGDGADPEVFTTIDGVTAINGPEVSTETIDTTSHTSVGAFRETVQTFINGGEVGIELNFDPTAGDQDAATGLLADLYARTRRNWKIVFPTTPVETFTFAARVSRFSPSAPFDGKLSASFTLTLDGPVTQS